MPDLSALHHQAHTWITTAKALDPNCPEDEAALGEEIVRALAQGVRAAEQRDALANAWLTVCQEGTIPAYRHVVAATAEGMLHGIRTRTEQARVAHARLTRAIHAALRYTALVDAPNAPTHIPNTQVRVLRRYLETAFQPQETTHATEAPGKEADRVPPTDPAL